MRSLAVARGALFVALPFVVYFALQRFEPRVVGLALLALLLTRLPRRMLTAVWAAGWRALLAAGSVLAIAALLWLANDPAWVRSYPVVINALLFTAFALSLARPPSVVERIARLRHGTLPPEAVAYTRRVTQLWCAFFAANGAIAAWTAFAASPEIWVLYNGLVAYLLIGALFAGEWTYRRLRFGARAGGR